MPKLQARRRMRLRAARFPGFRSLPSERLLQDLRSIGSRLRPEARRVLREYLGGLQHLGLDTVESATYLSCAFLNALLEEAPAVMVELTPPTSPFLRRRTRAARGSG